MAWTATLEHFTDRAGWLDARRAGIGASDSPSLFGIPTYHSALSLWTEKTGRAAAGDAAPPKLEYEPDGWSARTNPVFEGTHNEEGIARMFAAIDPRPIVDPRSWGPAGTQFVLFRHETHKHMTASPDRFIADPNDPKNPGALEIKLSRHKDEDWKDEHGNDRIPLDYQVQVQHQMFVTGTTWGVLVVWHVRKELMRAYEVKPDPAFQQALLEKCNEFWRRVKGELPQPEGDGSAATLEALREIYKTTDPGKCKEVSPAIIQEMLRGDAMEKAGKEIRGKAKAELMDAMGDAEYAVVGGAKVARWKIQKQAIMGKIGEKEWRVGPVLDKNAGAVVGAPI